MLNAGGEEGILFARVRQRAASDRRRQRQQVVGGIAHGGNNCDDVAPRGAIARDAGNDGRDALNGADRTPAVLLNEQL